MDLIRSFIAIELPDELRTQLGKLQDSLKTSQQNYVKWVNPYSIHLTLKFLGDITADKIDELVLAIEESAVVIPPFKLHIEGLGVFPSLKRIQVVWVGLAGELDKLLQLQKRIEENMAILGYAAEERGFTPHLTLGRLRFQPPLPEQQKFVQLLNSTKFESTNKIEVNAVNLMKSELTPQGAIYSKLGSIALKFFS